MGYKSKLLSKVVLSNRLDGHKGYLSTTTMSDMMDKEGETITELRPTGFMTIDNEKFDVLAESGFIPKNTKVKVVKVEGSKIFVRRI